MVVGAAKTEEGGEASELDIGEGITKEGDVMGRKRRRRSIRWSWEQLRQRRDDEGEGMEYSLPLHEN